MMLTDGRHLAYLDQGVRADTARFCIILPHSFLFSRLAGIPGLKNSLLEEFGVRLITYDLPGFRESDPHSHRTLESSALDMSNLADSLGVRDKFWVVGFSSSSMHIWAALRYIPDRITGSQSTTVASSSENKMMADRVHPRDTDSPPTSGEHSKNNNNNTPYTHRHTMSQDSLMSKESYAPYHSGPPSGTYVVQVPKDQIYRIPPPENARKFEIYQRRKNRGSRCRCCCCTILGIILLLAALIAIAGLLFYFIVKPKTPDYSVEDVSIEGFNLTSTSSSASISPEFKVTVKSENRNGKLGIHYESGGSVTIYHDDVKLCDGDLPVFYQRPKNVTVFAMNLKGSGIVLSSDEKGSLLSEEKQGKVGFKMDVIVPVKIKLGIIKTWRITAKVKCNVIVNGLSVDAKVVSKDCDVDVEPW